MNTQGEYNPLYIKMPTFASIDMAPISSDPDEDWLHPVLEMFRPIKVVEPVKEPRMYLIASTFGEEFDSDFCPEPTSAKDLPDIKILVHNFIHVVVEVWAGRRSASQIQSACHYSVFVQLLRKAGTIQTVGKIRKIHISQPLDGIVEATITVRYADRLRVVAIRFEGLDHRWLCTTLEMI
jgi:hypothetical protein